MKQRLFVTLLAVLVVGAAGSQTGVRQAQADSAPPINVPLNLAIMKAVPAPSDAPLLDASGQPVTDANGNVQYDPDEAFHQVIPFVYDPGNTHLVQSTWLDGIGCPTNSDQAAYPSTSPTGTYTDPACPTGDQKDSQNQGLLLVKTGPSTNNAAAGAELKKVRGITLTELGYDIRKAGLSTDPRGSHCGAGAPRFNITTSEAFYFLACDSPPADTQTPGAGWLRLRWGGTAPLMAYCVQTGGPLTACPANGSLVAVAGTVQRIEIIFDEGTDASPDNFGAAILDNIDVNGTLVGRGPSGSRGEVKDGDD